jgi:hypothetical protein
MKSILREINENFPVTCQPQEKPREAGPDMGTDKQGHHDPDRRKGNILAR